MGVLLQVLHLWRQWLNWVDHRIYLRLFWSNHFKVWSLGKYLRSKVQLMSLITFLKLNLTDLCGLLLILEN